MAIGADGRDSGVGSLYVLLLDRSSGIRLYALPAPQGVNGLGISVDISNDGKTIAGGAHGTNHDGAVAVYRSSASLWPDERLDYYLTWET